MSSFDTHPPGQRSFLTRTRREVSMVVIVLLFFGAPLAVGAESGGPPQLTEVSPNSGYADDRVVIRGLNLETTSMVEFNGVAARFDLVGDITPGRTMLIVYVPDGASNGPIKVTTSFGSVTTTESFTVRPGEAPELTQVLPNAGVVGERVLIRGRRLGRTSKVEFNGVAALFELTGDIDPALKTMIMAYVPESASSGPITVTTSYGSATTTESFTVLPGQAPIIASFVPASGPPGAMTIISGQHLKFATNVLLNGVPMSWGFGIDPINIQLFAFVPTNGTSGPITVSSRFGSATSTTHFTVTAPPPVTVNYWPMWLEAGFSDHIDVADSSPVTDVQLNGMHVPFTLGTERIILDVPVNAESGVLTVFTSAGSVSSPNPIPVYPHPVVDRLAPNAGAWPDTIKVLGQNLDVIFQAQLGQSGILMGVANVDSNTISFMVRDDATPGELIVITRKGNRILTGLTFWVSRGAITTRAGTISGNTPASAPTPITGITKAQPTRFPVRPGAKTASGQAALLNQQAAGLPALSILAVGQNTLRVSWPRANPAAVLEFADSSAGGQWAAVPLIPVAGEHDYQVFVPMAGKQQFFRLRASD